MVSFVLPNTVELLVTDAPPSIKGATATNQMKEAILETGLKTRVPPFINIGDAIKISTDIVARQKLSNDDRKLIEELDTNISTMEDEINKLKSIAFDRIEVRDSAKKKKAAKP